MLDKEAKNYKEKESLQHRHQNGKKTFIVDTSMVKGIKMKEVNSQLRNLFAKLKSFPGATLKHLRYYIVPSLIDEPH